MVARASVDVTVLVAAARDGQPAALARLLELYRNYLRLLARTWQQGPLRGKADPSDLVQETLLQAHQAFARFRGQGEGELVVWLRQIMAHKITDLARRLQADKCDAGREQPLTGRLKDKLRDMATTFSSPSAAAQRREASVLLADALAQLSPARREVIVLRNLEEQEWPEIARRMGKSEAAVKKLWARALLALRPLIEGAA
jgi:RNA polymerase sigma-70 factor, ECF subfamily